MTDIINRLRNEQMWASSALNKPAAALVCEAADEIERLRETNQKWLEYSQRNIEPELKRQVAELTFECKRLRAALQQIADVPPGNTYYGQLMRCAEIAKEALGDE